MIFYNVCMTRWHDMAQFRVPGIRTTKLRRDQERHSVPFISTLHPTRHQAGRLFEDGCGTPGTVCFLELGSWFMVDSIVDRVEARGKFRGCLATLMYQVQKHSFFTWECWPMEWLLCICGLDCSMRRWSVWTQSLENDCFRVMFWAFWHEALI